jgi:uncharacterized protein (DUF169 family)
VNHASRLNELLALKRRPVAVRFQQSPPEDLSRIDTSAVAGCTYWKIAAEGQSFYTEAADHYGCPIGAHTHGVDLPEPTAKELEHVVGTMVGLQYIAMAEVPEIPRMEQPFRVAVYAPLADATFDPDVVVVCGSPKQMMLVAEAAHAAGISSDTSMVGRPTCAAIPAVMQSGRSATNLGCIGNRVYTGLEDDELYFVVAGPRLDAIVEKLATIVNANQQLETYHQARQ